MSKRATFRLKSAQRQKPSALLSSQSHVSITITMLLLSAGNYSAWTCRKLSSLGNHEEKGMNSLLGLMFI